MFLVRPVGGVLLAVVLLTGWGAGPPASTPSTLTPRAEPIAVAFQVAGPRPENGTVLVDRGANGRGVLEINNGTSYDAVVTLAAGGPATHKVYVHNGATARIKSIPDASYTIYVEQGTGWDDNLAKFTADTQSSRFDSAATFVTERKKGSIQYTEFSITLHPVVDGTAEVLEVDPASIPG